jgi:hypothetical protein
MLGGLLGLRPDERRGAAVAFLTIFGILGAHTLLETARDALFLARLPARELPYVYLAIAALAVLFSLGPWRGKIRLSSRYTLSVVLGLCALVTAGLWAVGLDRPSTLYALYVWTGLEGSLAPLEFWLVLGEKYTVTQAKRVFGIVGAGSLLGAVAGAGVARLLVASQSPSSLVLVAAAIFALSALGPALLLKRPEGGAGAASLAQWASSFRHTLDLARRQPYVRGLGGLVLVSTVALTLGDYVFKSTVSRALDPEELGAFFANVNVATNVLGLVFQVALSGWLFRIAGLHRALVLLPALLALGAGGVAFGGGLAAALLLKGADGALRYSVHRTGSELLYVPLPDGLRARAKPFIDVVGQRGGQAIASVYLLAEASLNRGDSFTAAGAAALCFVWIVWTSDLREHYLNLFRSALKEGVVQSRTDIPALDLGSLEALFGSLNSRDDGEVSAAMDLLVEQGRVRLIPALILYHPSRVVVLRALDHFARAGRTDFVPIADRLLAHADPDIRAAALRGRTVVEHDEALLRRATGDDSPLVRATALVGLVAKGSARPEERQQLEAMVNDAKVETARSVARAIRAEPQAAFADLLLRLADSMDPRVRMLTAEAMGLVADDRFLPALLGMMAERRLRGEARIALVRFGDRALRFLSEALDDPSLPHEMRRHLPRTLSLFEPQAAAPVLQRHLLAETDGMVRYKILRALNRVALAPEVELDDALLARATRETLEGAFRLVGWRVALERAAGEAPARLETPGHELLVTLLRDKEVHAQERMFRLLALQYRAEDMKGIHRGLRAANPKVRAGSRELLENLLRPPLREAIVAFVDDAPDAERLARAVAVYVPRPLDYEAVLGVILDSSSESLRCVAAYHVGELGLTSLRPRLQALRPENTGFFLSRVAEHALKLLNRREGGTLAHA